MHHFHPAELVQEFRAVPEAGTAFAALENRNVSTGYLICFGIAWVLALGAVLVSGRVRVGTPVVASAKS